MASSVDEEKTTNELTDLETVEVSLVDKGANRRTFAIRKSEKNTMTVIEAILAAPFDKSEELMERLKKAELSEQAAEGVKSALQLLSAFQEELPESLVSEMMGLIGMSEEKAEEEDEEKEEKQEDPAEEATEEVAEEAAEAEEESQKSEEDVSALFQKKHAVWLNSFGNQIEAKSKSEKS